MNKRAIKIHSLDEYGQPFVHLITWEYIPVFFHNRPSARLTKVELIDYKEKETWPDREIVLQTIEEKPERIESDKAFQAILTAKELKND